MNLSQKVVVVTGASSGIGQACVGEFLRCGAFVVMASRNAEALHEVALQYDPSGQRTLVVPTDVTQPDQCRALIEAAEARFGHIDVVICNAGISMRAAFGNAELSVLRRVVEVNFWGTVNVAHYAMPHLLASRGTLVGITSIAAYIGLPGRAGYSASKFAMRGFLDTLRNEYLHSGVCITDIAPGFTASNIRYNALLANGDKQGTTPRNEAQMMQPSQVAAAIRRAVERRKKRVVLQLWEGKFAIFMNKWFPSLVTAVVHRKMRREPNAPFDN